MSLVGAFQHTRRLHSLLMHASSTTASARKYPSQQLKRSFAQQATAAAPAPAHDHDHDASVNDALRPGKVPRLSERISSPGASVQSQSESQSNNTAAPEFEMVPSGSGTNAKSWRRRDGPSASGGRSGGGGSGAFGGTSRGSSRLGARSGGGRSNRLRPPKEPKVTLSGPIHDLQWIKANHREDPTPDKPLKPSFEDTPKNTLNNMLQQSPEKVTYEMERGFIDGKQYNRVTAVVPGAEGIHAVGDDLKKNEAEHLAALSAIYQLHRTNQLQVLSAKSAKGDKKAAVQETQLSDGTAVTHEKARQFIDYYCRRFKFGRPDISTSAVKEGRRHRGGSWWEVVMIIGGRRIGIGEGSSKKAAQEQCYLDVTRYLEECDPDLWKTFVEDAKTGKDLGLAPSVALELSHRLEDEIRDLCEDVRKSTLYRNRPKIGSAKTGADAPEEPKQAAIPTGPRRSRMPMSQDALANKSRILKERREAYLQDEKQEKMRETRMSLPVYTKSGPLMQHVRENEVTICMAATGSGKTTQIPQIILDDYIDRGDGAKCNIVCTQPRRIAAISVADRVAKERGEVMGRGSVGYQVRFDSRLPEDHGSITFCTTGIFLKRLQSALSGDTGDGRNLDDVTHVLVDEVHERDVDVDLLLVVLRRLLEERRAQNKPIKIVLMSATIDPTLFQKYFPDARGRQAGVIEIPGRSFPVQKHFLEEFLPQLAETPQARLMLRDEAVVKYIVNELGPTVAARVLGEPRLATQADTMKDDIEIPYPLLALTICHVLQKTDSGHVLVFLPGWDDIINVQKSLLAAPMGINFNDPKQYSLHLLHSTVPLAEQQVIFDPPPKGVRRIILATNIAETSVTIPDVVYVVDTAKIKEMRYDPQRHISSLVSAWVGSSNLNQRAGRAGRHRPGEYFGILSKRRADALHPYQTVEMKRTDLSNVVMHVKALNFPGMAVKDVLAATIEPPEPDRVAAAMRNLQMVGALDDDEELTALGRVLLQLPVDAPMGRLVLYGSFFRCLDQALTLACVLTNRDPFLSPIAMKAEANARKFSFSPHEFRSDALAVLQAYNRWWAMQSRGEYVSANRFCSENFLSKPTLLLMQKTKSQLLQSLYDAGVIEVSAGGAVAARGRFERDLVVPEALNTNGDSLPLLAALLAIATQPNFAVQTGEKTFRTAQDKTTFIHPSSVNNRKRVEKHVEIGPRMEKQLYAFAEKRQNLAGGQINPQMFLCMTTRLDPMSYVLFGAYKLDVVERGLECDGWLPIVGPVDALDDIARLKTLMESCMLRVFEGIMMNKRHRYQNRFMVMPTMPREEESESESDDAPQRDWSMSPMEVKELDLLTRDIVRILEQYSEDRVQQQSRNNSRPGTPYGSPAFASLRLPSGNGPGSGTSTPYNIGSAFNSRPSTPSRLFSRR